MLGLKCAIEAFAVVTNGVSVKVGISKRSDAFLVDPPVAERHLQVLSTGN